MAAPNLLSLTSVTADSSPLSVSSPTLADLVIAVGTGHAKVVSKIQITNTHATATAFVNVNLVKSATNYALAMNRTVPIKTTVDLLLGGQVNLAEGDKIQISIGTGQTADAVACWSDMS